MKNALRRVSLFIAIIFPVLADASTEFARVRMEYPIDSPFYPIVLKSNALAQSVRARVEEISAWSVKNHEFRPIPYQIDKVDDDGILVVEQKPADTGQEPRVMFDANDEVVLTSADLGDQYSTGTLLPPHRRIVEVELVDPHTRFSAWFYLLVMDVGTVNKLKSTTEYVRYDPGKSLVETDTYSMVFSAQTPFLSDALKWAVGSGGGFSENVIDTMKIRHQGKLFHFLPFERTHGDYTSKVIAVKRGPVRLIRRTENRVHIALGIGTPAVYIDQLIYRNAFIMDIIIDMPFRVGAIFSDLTAVPTIEGRRIGDIPATYIHSENNLDGVAVTGKMTGAKKAFNKSGDQMLAISSDLGLIVASIASRDESEIFSRVYLVDDGKKPDSPENVNGQHGNAGFMMTGWENIDSQIHHILFRSYFVQGLSVPEGIEMLRRSPHFH